MYAGWEGSVAMQHAGTRFKALRQERGFSRDDHARRYGFEDRQTAPALETGATAEEQVAAVLS